MNSNLPGSCFDYSRQKPWQHQTCFYYKACIGKNASANIRASWKKWKPEADFITREHEEQGFGGRFGAGLPRINDGAILFLQHMISKMKDPKEGGTRLGIVFNGSPLFTGAAGSGESEIRRWIIENEWLEAIVALPDQLFYNTGINTCLWIVNRKEQGRKGKIQLVDGTSFFKKMRKSLGNKRNEVCDDKRDEITRLYGSFQDGGHVRVFDNEDFGYRRITVERPLRLNFAVDEGRIARLKEATAFANLATSKKRKDAKSAEKEIAEGKKLQEDILNASGFTVPLLVSLIKLTIIPALTILPT